MSCEVHARFAQVQHPALRSISGVTSPRVPRAYRAAVAVARPLLRMMTTRTWDGVDNLPEGPFIAAANHVSYADPFTLLHFLIDQGRYPKALAKHTLFSTPGLGSLLRAVGMIPVYRGTDQASGALDDALAQLEAGECIAVFPEGTLTQDPDLWPMVAKTGVVRLALAARVPLVPIGQWGAEVLLPQGARIPRAVPRKPVTVIAGAPVDLSDFYDQPLEAGLLRDASARLMSRITELVAHARRANPPDTPFDPRQAAEPDG